MRPLFFQTLSSLLDLNQNRSKLKLYISHLTSLCQERDPITLQDFSPPPAYHRSDSASWHVQLRSMTQEQVSVRLVTSVLSPQILVRVQEQNTVNPAGFWQCVGFFLTLLKRFTPSGHLTTSSWRWRSYNFQGFNLRGSKFHLLAAGGEVGGFMCRTRRGDEEYIYLTVKRVVNRVWEEKKRSEAKRGCSSLVMVINLCCQAEIINTILFNKKNKFQTVPAFLSPLHIENLSGNTRLLHVVYIEKP